jgi:uncharacterized protein (DUF2336 family)
MELAKERSSERRRELLRDVTDLFFVPANHSQRETELFDEILCSLATEVPIELLAEVSDRFADAPNAPRRLIQQLANEPIEVAQPVLRRSTLLSDEDLVRVINARSQEHIRAVAERDAVSTFVADAIADRGDDATLDTLMRNQGARLSRRAMEIVVDRAHENPALHDSVVARKDVPLELVNELYFKAEARLRAAILKRNASVDPVELEQALNRARVRVTDSVRRQNLRLADLQAKAKEMQAAGELNGRNLLALHREGRTELFLCCLGLWTGLDYEIVRLLMENRDLDGLAMICRATEIERPLFVSLACLCDGGPEGMRRAEEYGRLYAAVPVEAAQRAMRFYRVRKTSEAQRAA